MAVDGNDLQKNESWNTEITRERVFRLYGRTQLDRARPCLRSADDRQIYARIHFQDARKLFDSYADVNLRDKSLFEVLGSDEAIAEFNDFIRRVGAYTHACAQSMHALADTLAHAVYYCLNLQRFNPTMRNVNIWSIKDYLKEPDVTALRDVLEAVTESGFDHLAALVNHSKHESLISPCVLEDTGTGRKEIVLPAFNYWNTHAKQLFDYPQVIVSEFLTPEYERLSRQVVMAGNALNSVLDGRLQDMAK